jgi:import inner membrane translocase subunit TIM21
LRAFSSNNNTESSSKAGQTSSQQQSEGDDKNAAEDPSKEIVLTPGEKVVVASRLTMWAGIAVFASFCAYFIVRELLPT